MIKLHGMTGSGNCWKAWQILVLSGQDFTWIETIPNEGDTRTPAFLALNPNGKVPVVVLGDGAVITESNAILTHFAEGTTWLPAPGLPRTRVMEWLFFEQYSHEPAIAVARSLRRFSTATASPERLASLHEAGKRALDVMERRLGAGAFLAGDTPSIADLALFAYTHVASEGGFDLATWPGVNAWVARVAALPGIKPMG